MISILVQPLWDPNKFDQYDEPFGIWWRGRIHWQNQNGEAQNLATYLGGYSDTGGLDTSWQTPHFDPKFNSVYWVIVDLIVGVGEINGLDIDVSHPMQYEARFHNDDDDFMPWLDAWKESTLA